VHRWLLPLSAVLGSVLLIASDVLGRVLARPAEVQAGIVTALVGVPFLVALVRRAAASRRERLTVHPAPRPDRRSPGRCQRPSYAPRRTAVTAVLALAAAVVGLPVGRRR
jgi:hypothetical protein